MIDFGLKPYPKEEEHTFIPPTYLAVNEQYYIAVHSLGSVKWACILNGVRYDVIF